MKDSAGNNHYSIQLFDSGVAFGDHGQIEPFTDGHDSEACVVRLRERFGCNMEAVHEVIDEVLESFGSDGNLDAKAAVRKQNELIERAWIVKRGYVKNNGDPDMAERCCALLLGFPAVAGTDSQQGLVRLLSQINNEDVIKQAVNKCFKYFKRKMPELPHLQGQRGKAARKRMSDGRNKQLTK